MIDEEHLRRVPLSEKPLGQRIVANLLLLPNYDLPPKTEIVLEGVENVPRDRRVIFALNHTDRYNYWPFQYQMYRHGGLPFTVSWVKAKYYENRYLGWFFDRCNNIPLPSRGYLILQDARALLGRNLKDDEYRYLRDFSEGKKGVKPPGGILSTDLRRVLDEPRRDFDPRTESYADFIERWNSTVMGLVEKRTLEALFEKKNNVIVFPQGTRSIRLLPGRTGLVQFALRHDVPVVPVGSNGCEKVYPGGSPWAKGGRIVYRIGRAMTLADDLADCRIEEPYRPFQLSAEIHAAVFERATGKITERINALLDEPYRMDDSATADARTKARSFL